MTTAQKSLKDMSEQMTEMCGNIISEEAVLSGKIIGQTMVIPLWRDKKITNEASETIVIDRLWPQKEISHVFEFPSIKDTISYYHAAAGLSTKETWVKAKSYGKYNTWLGLSVKAPKNHFPESK